jgi:hypothetical protein
VKLTIEDGPDVENATASQVEAALRALPEGCFVVLDASVGCGNCDSSRTATTA